MKMRLHIALLAVLFLWPCVLWAQGPWGLGHYIGELIDTQGRAVTNATITVCTEPSFGKPCSPQATVYSDYGQTQQLTMPFTGDKNGNFEFYGSCTTAYHLQVTAPTTLTFDVAYVYIPCDLLGLFASPPPLGTKNPNTVVCTICNSTQGYEINGTPVIDANRNAFFNNLTVAGSETIAGDLSVGGNTTLNNVTINGTLSTGPGGIINANEINGAPVPPNASYLGSNAAGQLIVSTAPGQVNSDWNAVPPNPAAILNKPPISSDGTTTNFTSSNGSQVVGITVPNAGGGNPSINSSTGTLNLGPNISVPGTVSAGAITSTGGITAGGDIHVTGEIYSASVESTGNINSGGNIHATGLLGSANLTGSGTECASIGPLGNLGRMTCPTGGGGGGNAPTLTNDANGTTGGRFKAWATGQTCATTGAAGNVCTGSFPIPGTAFSGTYYIVCSGGPGNSGGFPRLLYITPMTGSQFGYGITNGEANMAQISSYTVLYCMAFGT